MRRFQNILVHVDSSRDPPIPLEQAALIAKRIGARLEMVDVVPDFSWPTRIALREADRIRALIADQKRRRLDELAAPLKAEGLAVDVRVLMGRTSDQLLSEVARQRHDLLVRETKGLHSRRAGFLGTTSLQLLRRCPCAMWLVKPEQPAKIERILAAVDATAHDQAHCRLNAAILDIATSLSIAEGCCLEVAFAWSIYGENVLRDHLKPEEFAELERNTRADHEQALEQLLAGYDMVARENVHLLRGDAGHEIPKYVQGNQVDLLVMGTVARKGLAGWLIGNTAERIFDKVPCSLLAVKPEGIVSAIRSA